MAGKIHSTVYFFYFLCVKICSTSSKNKTKQNVKASQSLWLSIKNNHRPSSIIKYKRQTSLSYLECIDEALPMGKEEGWEGAGPSKCIKHPNQIYIYIKKIQVIIQITFLNPFGHSCCLFKQSVTGMWTEPVQLGGSRKPVRLLQTRLCFHPPSSQELKQRINSRLLLPSD